MTETSESRGTKRTSAHRATDTGKRRAPYALRACEACRRRKGKCDGRHPCGHCVGRGQNCFFSSSSQGPAEWSDIPTLANDADQVAGHQLDEPANPAVSSASGGSIFELVSSLKDQLDSLTSHVRSSSGPPIPTNLPSAINLPPSFQSQSPERIETGPSKELAGSDGQPHRQTSQGFYGPTSPDYSLNVAQMKIREAGSATSPSQRPQLPSIDDADASDDDSGIVGVDVSGLSRDAWPPRNQRGQLHLQQFRSLMNLQEAARLLFVYQEVVGDFHPLVDLDDLMSKTRVWYTGEPSARGGRDYSPVQVKPSTDENDLLILNLALAIGLRAESTPCSTSSNIESMLQSSFQDIVNAKVVSPASSIKDVKIILLTALYFFFQDMLRSAWRMCGIAGRVLMELGFHNGDVSRHVLDSETERTEVAIVMCSIVTLDRQWSAATGLPTNFQHSSFEPLPKSSIKNPYLKAMLSFIQISDKFNDPISCAAKGERYEDQDAFDVMNFQVEQWRKKAVDNQPISNFGTWHSNPSARPPSWAIVLHLRADSIRSLLLRPCFFSESEVETGREHLRPALDLASHMVNVLFTLDTTTDIYRTQHPYYQHLLASACALFFLLIAFVKQNHASLAGDLTVDFVDSVSRIFRMTLTLAGTYAKTSRASRRLWKRLSEMRVTLANLNLLPDPLPEQIGQHFRTNVVEPESSTGQNARYTQNTGASRSSWRGRFHGQGPGFSPPVIEGNATQSFSAALGTFPDNDLQLAWPESLLSNWPMGDDNVLFSEGMF